uniref:UBC core domain-containing protein n=1 Tax=Gopherus evgoodei TaxID=1825980 RepID=A0A8C4YUQ7_9SAUR
MALTDRVQKELADITLDPSPNCSAGPKGDNIYEWRSTILGSPAEQSKTEQPDGTKRYAP